LFAVNRVVREGVHAISEIRTKADDSDGLHWESIDNDTTKRITTADVLKENGRVSLLFYARVGA
jgi:hypothetical protein